MGDIFCTNQTELQKQMSSPQFSPINSKIKLKEKKHQGKSFVSRGKKIETHSTLWQVGRVIESLMYTILVITIVPLFFKSYRNLLERTWKEGTTGKEEVHIYALKVFQTIQQNNPENQQFPQFFQQNIPPQKFAPSNIPDPYQGIPFQNNPQMPKNLQQNIPQQKFPSFNKMQIPSIPSIEGQKPAFDVESHLYAADRDSSGLTIPEALKKNLPPANYYAFFSSTSRFDIDENDFQKFLANRDKSLPVVILAYRFGLSQLLDTPINISGVSYNLLNLRFGEERKAYEDKGNVELINNLKKALPKPQMREIPQQNIPQQTFSPFNMPMPLPGAERPSFDFDSHLHAEPFNSSGFTLPETIKKNLPPANYYAFFSSTSRFEIDENDFQKFLANRDKSLPVVILAYRFGLSQLLDTPINISGVSYNLLNLRFGEERKVYEDMGNVELINNLKKALPK